MSLITDSEILDLIRKGHRWIDVRAPVEFISGSIPNTINLPILDNEERRLIGTCYKEKGRETAITLGYSLVSGDNREQKIQRWIEEIKHNPDLSLFCFRGGLRSKISQQWLKDAGFPIRRVEGGYKNMRLLLIQYLNQAVEKSPIRLISGPTGSWKTQLVQWIAQSENVAIDLEQCASHRGSAFGKQGPQPEQVNFEHKIVKSLMLKESELMLGKPIYLEDESRLIGRCIVPDFLFEKMRASPVLWVEESLENRIQNIYFDYIESSDITKSSDLSQVKAVYKGFQDSLGEIRKKLGHDRYSEILKDIIYSETMSLNKNDHNSNRIWIGKLLQFYYDPLYLSSLKRRDPVKLVKGTVEEVKSFISSNQ